MTEWKFILDIKLVFVKHISLAPWMRSLLLLPPNVSPGLCCVNDAASPPPSGGKGVLVVMIELELIF